MQTKKHIKYLETLSKILHKITVKLGYKCKSMKMNLILIIAQSNG